MKNNLLVLDLNGNTSKLILVTESGQYETAAKNTAIIELPGYSKSLFSVSTKLIFPPLCRPAGRQAHTSETEIWFEFLQLDFAIRSWHSERSKKAISVQTHVAFPAQLFVTTSWIFFIRVSLKFLLILEEKTVGKTVFFILCVEFLKRRTVPENAMPFIHLKFKFRRSQWIHASIFLQDPNPKLCISGVGSQKTSHNHPSIRILTVGKLRNLLLVNLWFDFTSSNTLCTVLTCFIRISVSSSTLGKAHWQKTPNFSIIASEWWYS